MKILANATPDEIVRLLLLFPLANLKSEWPEFNTDKAQLCAAAATTGDFKRIALFVANNFGACKQHIYVRKPSLGDEAVVPISVPKCQTLFSVPGQRGVFLARKEFEVVDPDTLTRSTFNFLWPVLVQAFFSRLVVRFVMLEKNVGARAESRVLVANKGIQELDVLANVHPVGLGPEDLHKGIKALWREDFVDSFRLKLMKPESTSEETMHRAKGIKKLKPDLFKEAMDHELLFAAFSLEPLANSTVHNFSIKPAEGYLAVGRYTDRNEDVENVVAEIIKRNQ